MQSERKCTTLGFEPRDDRCATFLNGQEMSSEDTLELEADLRHAIEVIRKSNSTPVVKEAEFTATHDQQPLDKCRASIFRSVCMPAVSLSIDRYDLQYVSKEAARETRS